MIRARTAAGGSGCTENSLDTNEAPAVDELCEEPAAQIRVLYANVRGLRQAVGELRAMVLQYEPEIVVLTETHMNGDSIEAEMLSEGYKVVTRFDRTAHGGGVVILAQDQLLLNEVKCGQWRTRKSAEIIGCETDEWAVFGCYT